jgi:3',5'-cyclic AMP phosphodiesterase CpdA
MAKLYTRRRFIGMMAAGGALLTTGCARWRVSHDIGDNERGPLRFVFYTDIHCRTEWDTPLAMEKAARAINDEKPDLTIVGGDLITDGFQSSAETVAPRWETYMSMHDMIEGDIYPVIGNHDLVSAITKDGTPPAEDPRAIYRAKMGLDSTYYSFDAAGYHFVVLDSIYVTGDDLKYNGFIWPEQIEWIKEDLSRIAKDTPIVLLSHIPLITVFYAATEGMHMPAPENRILVNNRRVLRLFRDHHLLLVLQGHLHALEMMQWRNITFITGGAICAQWWRGPWFDTEEGFCVVTLNGDRIDWEYVDYEWEARRPKDQ